MSNYSYLRQVIENLMQKGNVPDKVKARTLKLVRSNSKAIKTTKDYLKSPYSTLYDDLIEHWYDIPGGIGNPNKYYAPSHNKYGKYMPAAKRLKVKEDMLNELIDINKPNSQDVKKLSKSELESLMNKYKKYSYLLNELKNSSKYNKYIKK